MSARVITSPAGEHNVWPVEALRMPGGALRLPVQSQEYRPYHDPGGAHLGNDLMFMRLPDEPTAPPRACGRFYVPGGVRVLACAPGVVETVTRAWNGWRVYLDHPTGWRTLYLHLAEAPPVRVGQKVQAGGILGLMGGDPSDDDPAHTVHLHFEMRRLSDGYAVDPWPYLEQWPHLVLDATSA